MRGDRFLRAERLHLRRESQKLFAQGRRVFKFPYRALYLEERAASSPGIALMVQAPKRLFKRATARNAQKRRIREAFRLQAHALRAHAHLRGSRIILAIMLVSNEPVPAERGHRAVRFILQQVLAAAEHHAGSPSAQTPSATQPPPLPPSTG